MDVKALAKSKRAHSQHHSKRPHGNHQSQKHKAPSSSDGATDAGTANKSLGKQAKEKTHRPQGSPGLPSNWDRYDDEELDFGSEGVSLGSASKTSDVILPKSKGADYRHLVSEAQSQANASLEAFPSLDDVLSGEFNEGVRAMLAVRGEGILSWIGDDNFLVEDKTSGTHEASFLSLNLHALAENLAKVELSKRLFIEVDLLPHELCVEGPVASDHEEPDKLQTTEETELANRTSEALSLDDSAVDVKIADQLTSSSSCGTSQAASTEVNLHSTKDPTRKLPTFEPAAAEEELDMLLDSVSEIKILDSPGFLSDSKAPFPVSLGLTSVDASQIYNNESDSSKTVMITESLDDALDDLLEETSNIMNRNAFSQPREEKSVLHSAQSSSHSGTKSKVLDEFDSWLDTI
ncbi:phosphorelay protein [Senna tora]|uniref:Phosphorelay protein n=1 Tax=Senna tora TaxID=362788 RepID=A0A834SRC8_9FABA|nr:phosphorelay protein [Senna tora]